MKWQRIAPGYYKSGDFTIVQAENDAGYGTAASKGALST